MFSLQQNRRRGQNSFWLEVRWKGRERGVEGGSRREQQSEGGRENKGERWPAKCINIQIN
jgi:hypothetical protein